VNSKRPSYPIITVDPGVAIAMSAQKLLAIAVASLVLLGGAAAVGAASPADQANGNASVAMDETPDENETEELEAPDEVPTDRPEAEMPADRPGMNGPGMGADNGNGSEAGNSVGPADGLPSQVPDHVSAIHDTIGSFLDGSIDNLGEALSDLLGGDAEGPDETGPAAGEA
jgi:hypothetical protein